MFQSTIGRVRVQTAERSACNFGTAEIAACSFVSRKGERRADCYILISQNPFVCRVRILGCQPLAVFAPFSILYTFSPTLSRGNLYFSFADFVFVVCFYAKSSRHPPFWGCILCIIFVYAVKYGGRRGNGRGKPLPYRLLGKKQCAISARRCVSGYGYGTRP